MLHSDNGKKKKKIKSNYLQQKLKASSKRILGFNEINNLAQYNAEIKYSAIKWDLKLKPNRSKEIVRVHALYLKCPLEWLLHCTKIKQTQIKKKNKGNFQIIINPNEFWIEKTRDRNYIHSSISAESCLIASWVAIPILIWGKLGTGMTYFTP